MNLLVLYTLFFQTPNFFQLYYSIYSLYGDVFDLFFMFLFIVSARA